MRFAVAVICCVPFVAAVAGCSANKFAGEWLEESRLATDGQYHPTEGPRRMAIKFEPIATVRTGAYVDGPGVVDADTQAKIDVVKSRLIRDYGYDDESATDVLNYVASIFARGDVKRG